MSVLAEFLNHEAKRLEAERPTREAEVAEWRAAVEALFGQLKEWITAADAKGVLTVTRGETTCRERRLGVYTVLTLSVTLDGETVSFVPKSRGVAGALVLDEKSGAYRWPGVLDPVGAEQPLEGLVEVIALGTAQETLHRIRPGGLDVWLVWQPHGGRYIPLTQTWFEALLVRELQ